MKVLRDSFQLVGKDSQLSCCRQCWGGWNTVTGWGGTVALTHVLQAMPRDLLQGRPEQGNSACENVCRVTGPPGSEAQLEKLHTQHLPQCPCSSSVVWRPTENSLTMALFDLEKLGLTLSLRQSHFHFQVKLSHLPPRPSGRSKVRLEYLPLAQTCKIQPYKTHFPPHIQQTHMCSEIS